MGRKAKILDKIVEIAIYCLIFIIPFSKAGIEIFATIAIAGWTLKRSILCFEVCNVKGSKTTSFFPQTPLNRPVFVLFIIFFISMLFSAYTNLSLEGVFLKLGEYIFLFFICADIFSTKEGSHVRFGILSGVIIASIMLLFADAVFQWVTNSDFIRGFTMARLRACFSNANDFSGYIIAILPVTFCMIFVRLAKVKIYLRLILRCACIGLFLVGLILLGKTLARSAWLGYLVSMLFVGVVGLITNARQRFFAVSALLCLCIPLILGMVYFEPIENRFATVKLGFGSSTSRLYQWKEAIAIIEDFPILGAGPNTYTSIGSGYKIGGKVISYPHNSYLHMAAEVGILGLLSFFYILWRFFGMGLNVARRREAVHAYNGDRYLLLGIMGGILATLTQSFFDTNLFALRLVVLFWLMLGIGEGRMKYLKEAIDNEKKTYNCACI